jgi:dTDP-4-amino-4,6-dideoxygalactose transaminase
MIQLFNINTHKIDTSEFSNLLHDDVVIKFERVIAEYVGAKYACSVNSATSAIFLSLLNKNVTIDLPSMIPPVVANAIITSGNKINFIDDVDWVGHSYILHQFDDYKVVDSAQKLEKNQFKKECNPQDLMIFSFYPTKPLGRLDGGMVVTDDYEKYK